MPFPDPIELAVGATPKAQDANFKSKSPDEDATDIQDIITSLNTIKDMVNDILARLEAAEIPETPIP